VGCPYSYTTFQYRNDIRPGHEVGEKIENFFKTLKVKEGDRSGRVKSGFCLETQGIGIVCGYKRTNPELKGDHPNTR
jgi:hypothetical protein